MGTILLFLLIVFKLVKIAILSFSRGKLTASDGTVARKVFAFKIYPSSRDSRVGASQYCDSSADGFLCNRISSLVPYAVSSNLIVDHRRRPLFRTRSECGVGTRAQPCENSNAI